MNNLNQFAKNRILNNMEEITKLLNADDNINEDTYISINKRFFLNWMSNQKKNDGSLYSDRTILNYNRVLESELIKKMDIKEINENIFEENDAKKINYIIRNLENDKKFIDYNNSSNRTPKSALMQYYKFLMESEIINFKNLIIFGAPGTGKSFLLEENRKMFFGNKFTRITFHPNYTYSQFIGSFKPISKSVEENGNIKDVIAYEFVPGPFLNVLLEALKDEEKSIPHIIVIEEINRANPAAVFGDVFQLLDRDCNGKSSYTINMSNEMKKYVCKELEKDIDKLYIPNNMYIWATMNSADQGVYPMDSAFKRRWSFEYLGINENENSLKGKEYEFIYLKNNKGSYDKYEWNKVRKTINDKLKNKVNEDKLLGPYFLSRSELLKGSKKGNKEFDNIFKSKVLMYLYEDILKHKKIEFFIENVTGLSDIMDAYDNGKIFNFEIEKVIEEESSLEYKNESENEYLIDNQNAAENLNDSKIEE